jgi:hypothetical protein
MQFMAWDRFMDANSETDLYKNRQPLLLLGEMELGLIMDLDC